MFTQCEKETVCERVCQMFEILKESEDSFVEVLAGFYRWVKGDKL